MQAQTARRQDGRKRRQKAARIFNKDMGGKRPHPEARRCVCVAPIPRKDKMVFVSIRVLLVCHKLLSSIGLKMKRRMAQLQTLTAARITRTGPLLVRMHTPPNAAYDFLREHSRGASMASDLCPETMIVEEAMFLLQVDLAR